MADAASAIVGTRQTAQPDSLALAESWATDAESQRGRLAGPLHPLHHTFSGVTAREDEKALSGVAVNRWPIVATASHTFGGARVEYAEVSGPRGPFQVYGVVMDAGWLEESRHGQDAVRQLLTHVHQREDDSVPLATCGDFDCDPDSDGVRLLAGRAAASVTGLSSYDAWEVGGPSVVLGATWSNDNPHAIGLLWPERGVAYILTATRRRGGAGHPLNAALLGASPVDGLYPSDHYAVQADVRY